MDSGTHRCKGWGAGCLSATVSTAQQVAQTDIRPAALWLATGGADKTKAVVPQLRDRFYLSARDACEAIREANLIRARAA
jgi:hypothetical protein